jgi:hypothetical protein
MYAFADDHDEIYNLLNDVESANTFLRSKGNFDDVLMEIGRLVIGFNLQNLLGVRLLHKHNDISSRQFMIEDQENSVSDGLTLTTRRMNRSNINFDYIPSIWRCCVDGSIEPIEFCRSTLTDVEVSFFLTHMHIFQNIAVLIKSHGLEQVLGLCLLNKSSLPHDSDSEALVEYIDIFRSANIVKIRPKWMTSNLNYLETTWEFRTAETMTCVRNCYSYCVVYSPGHAIKHHSWHAGDD